jgi:hypothetical protein
MFSEHQITASILSQVIMASLVKSFGVAFYQYILAGRLIYSLCAPLTTIVFSVKWVLIFHHVEDI